MFFVVVLSSSWPKRYVVPFKDVLLPFFFLFPSTADEGTDGDRRDWLCSQTSFRSFSVTHTYCSPYVWSSVWYKLSDTGGGRRRRFIAPNGLGLFLGVSSFLHPSPHSTLSFYHAERTKSGRDDRTGVFGGRRLEILVTGVKPIMADEDERT